MNMTPWLLTVFALLALVWICSAQPGVKITREKILEQNERRKAQLNLMLVEARGKLADHNAGKNLLEDEEKKKLERRAEVVQKKLEKIEEVDEEEIQRQIRREQLRLERRRNMADEL